MKTRKEFVDDWNKPAPEGKTKLYDAFSFELLLDIRDLLVENNEKLYNMREEKIKETVEGHCSNCGLKFPFWDKQFCIEGKTHEK